MNINNVKVIDKGKELDGKIRIQNKKNKKKINFKIYKYFYILLISLFFIYVKIGLIEYCKDWASKILISSIIPKGNNSTIQKEYIDFNNISKIKNFIYFQKIIELKNEEYDNKHLTIETIQNQIGQINSIN
jgi:membrane-anchored glycerophosphoryl diester phosphodiesterase (GDPDase)